MFQTSGTSHSQLPASPIPQEFPQEFPQAPKDFGQVSMPKGQSWRCPLTSSRPQELGSEGISWILSLLFSLGAAASEPCQPSHPNISSQIHRSRLEKEHCPSSLGETQLILQLCTIPLTEGEAELPIPSNHIRIPIMLASSRAHPVFSRGWSRSRAKPGSLSTPAAPSQNLLQRRNAELQQGQKGN